MKRHMQNHRASRPRRPHAAQPGTAGFTIMELMVAVAIASIIILLTGMIFFQTTDAVSRGTALSDVIAANPPAAEVIDGDTNKMVGPHEGPPGDAGGGYIVILQTHYANIEFLKPFGSQSNSASSDITASRYTTFPGLYPDTPTGANLGLFNESREGDSIFRSVRSDQLYFVRYLSKGMTPIAPATAGTFAPPDLAGRSAQATIAYLHLKSTETDGSPPTEIHLGEGIDKMGNSWILGRQALYLVGGVNPWWDILGNPRTDLANRIRGLHDTARGTLDQLDVDAGRIVGEERTPTDARLTPILAADHSTNDYADRALSMLTFANDRLQANPRPVDTDFTSDRIAQMHPVLLERVSDFIVEFAADIHTGSTANGTPDGKVDVDTNGNIKWYTGRAYANRPNGPNGHDPTRPTTWETPNGWRPRVSNPTGDVTNGFVFRHDDDMSFAAAEALSPPSPTSASKWPYLIRLRYRIHDAKGKLRSADKQHGVWFEQILPVNRPY